MFRFFSVDWDQKFFQVRHNLNSIKTIIDIIQNLPMANQVPIQSCRKTQKFEKRSYFSGFDFNGPKSLNFEKKIRTISIVNQDGQELNEDEKIELENFKKNNKMKLKNKELLMDIFIDILDYQNCFGCQKVGNMFQDTIEYLDQLHSTDFFENPKKRIERLSGQWNFFNKNKIMSLYNENMMKISQKQTFQERQLSKEALRKQRNKSKQIQQSLDALIEERKLENQKYQKEIATAKQKLQQLKKVVQIQKKNIQATQHPKEASKHMNLLSSRLKQKEEEANEREYDFIKLRKQHSDKLKSKCQQIEILKKEMNQSIRENSEFQNLERQKRFYQKEYQVQKNKNLELRKEVYLLKGSSIYE